MLLVSTTCMAQNNKKNAPQQFDRTEQMVKELGLSDKQAQQLKALNQKYNKNQPPRGNGNNKGQAQKPSNNNKGNQQPPQMTDEQKKQMKSEHEAYEKELKKILSDKQYKTYQQNQKKP